MASDLRCDDHPDAAAAFIIGNADTGEQSFYCPLCTGIFGLTMALAFDDESQLWSWQLSDTDPEPGAAATFHLQPNRGATRGLIGHALGRIGKFVVLRLGACIGGTNALGSCLDAADCPGGQCGDARFAQTDTDDDVLAVRREVRHRMRGGAI